MLEIVAKSLEKPYTGHPVYDLGDICDMKGKARIPNFSHDRVRDVLDYNPATGVFVWKVSPAKNVKVGAIAGSDAKGNGYKYVTVDREEVTTSRLAMFYMNGVWPDRRVQFVNGDKTDCRFENLTLFNGLAGEFDHRTRDGRNAYARQYRKMMPHVFKNQELRKGFGISLDDYQRMLSDQGGQCGICGSTTGGTRHGKDKAFAVDHCHETGKVRGLLCEACNQGIGKMKDDPVLLRKAADYIESHRGSSSHEKH